MDLSIPQFLLSLLLLGFSYAQHIKISPDKTQVIGKVNGDGLVFQCDVEGDLADGADAGLQWSDPSDNVIGGYSSNKDKLENRIHIKRVNPKRLQLVFRDQALRGTDAGTYTCKAAGLADAPSKGIKLHLVEKIQVLSNKTQQPRIYTDALIECNFTGKPTPEVSWTKGEKRESVVDNDKYTQEKFGLRIRNISKADNGLYICEISSVSEEYADYKELEVTVKVTVPPKMKGPASVDDAIVGKRFQMSCEANGEPQPQFVFKKENIVLEGERYKVSQEYDATNDLTRGTLVIEKIEDSDEGNYQCLAQNKGGKDDNTLFVDVRVPPTISEIINVTGKEGSEVALVCVAKADPAPAVSWRITGTDEVITAGSEEGITLERDEDKNPPLITTVTEKLIFSKLKPRNTNNYTCTASNSAGDDSKVGTVSVEFKPNFANTPYSRTYGWINHNTEIKCVVDAVPYPSIKWRHKGQPISGNGNFQISQEKGVRQLIGILTVNVNIENENTIFGTYTCVANNMHGESTHDIELQKAVKPNAPVVSIEEVTPTTINLLIIPPTQDGGQPIIDYKIVYHVENEPDKATTRKADISLDPEEPRTQFLITGLLAKTKYLISVTARNEVGYGTEATITEETPAIQVPGMPKITSPTKSAAANEYTLTWETPRSGGTDLTGYNVKYMQVELEEDKEGNKKTSHVIGNIKADRVDIKDVQGNSYTLRGLNPDSHYELQLSAINAIGESMAETLIFKTEVGGTETGGGASGGVSSTGTNSENRAPSPTLPVKTETTRQDAEKPMATGAIIGIIIAVIIILFIVIDVTFYFTKQCGLLWTLKGKVAGGEGSAERTDAEAADHEKEAFIKEGKQDSEEPSAKENVDMVNETEKGDEETKDKELEPEDKEEKVDTEPAPEAAEEAQESAPPAGSPQTESAPPETSTEPAPEAPAEDAPAAEKDPKV